ncbi:MAG: hypothetical protein ACI8Z5_001394, partial [Lentimonas sp.]
AFIKQLFGDLPKFFSSEANLRELWSQPGTCKKLLETLSENDSTAPNKRRSSYTTTMPSSRPSSTSCSHNT